MGFTPYTKTQVYEKVFPPFFFGTAAYEGPLAVDNSFLYCSTYANGVADEIELDCKYAEKHYQKFMSVV